MGIDLGTSGVKVLLTDHSGNTVALSKYEYGISVPQKNYAEQHPDMWWDAVCHCIKDCLNRIRYSKPKICGIGLSGQMHSTVLLNDECKPAAPAILWCDSRSSAERELIYAALSDDDFNKVLLNPVAVGFQVTSLIWIMKNRPDLYTRTKYVLSAKDYIRFKLTGTIGTDYSDASGTLLMNIPKKTRAYEVMEKLNIDRELFPPLGYASDVAGYTNNQAKISCGLDVGIPVVYGGGDQPVQAIGNGVIRPGQVSSTIGTGGQLLAPLDTPIFDEKLRTHTFISTLKDKWFIMGASLTSGLCIKWLSENLLNNISYREMDELASRKTSDGIFFLPYLTGERTPHMDSEIRALFYGLSLHHDRSNIISAVYEGICFALKDSFELFTVSGVGSDKIIASGGGSSCALLMQMQADMFNRPIYRSTVTEQACAGACILAGVGAGIYPSIEDGCNQICKTDSRIYHPIPENAEKYDKMHSIYKKLYECNKNIV